MRPKLISGETVVYYIHVNTECSDFVLWRLSTYLMAYKPATTAASTTPWYDQCDKEPAMHNEK